MAFNTTPVAMDRVKSTKWELFDDPVGVEDSYVYLGTIIPANRTGWKDIANFARTDRTYEHDPGKGVRLASRNTCTRRRCRHRSDRSRRGMES